MHNRLILAGLAATGGLLTTAFLQTAVAVADAGADAFTIGGFTFDPQLAAGGEGFDPVAQLTTSPRCWNSVAERRSACRSLLRTSTSTTPPAAPNWGASRATRRLPASSA